jgi:hypothetical protein
MAITVTPTNAGLNLQRDAQNGAASSVLVGYIAIGSGIGILSTALVNGNPYTSLSFAAGITAPVANSESLTLSTIDGLHTQVVTASAPAIVGATSISVTSFNANFAYPTGAGIMSTPVATQTTLDTEFSRAPLTSAVAGASAGEALWTLYIPPPTVGYQIFEVGIFAGSGASGTLNSGVMIGRALYASAQSNLTSEQLVVDSII